MEVRDPIHGLIEYGKRNKVEEKLINHRLLQRLRRIRQLALACYVYPGALHTRFDHALGVMHLAGRVATGLKLHTECSLLRIAGLLHDVGHGPFSHVSEAVFERLGKDAPWFSTSFGVKARHIHEALTIVLLDEFGDVLSSTVRIELKRLFQKEVVPSVLVDIISGPLDVDRCDYLLRDSYFSGVKYGVFDIEKVLGSLVQIEAAAGGKELGVRDEGVYAVEQFLLAKYHMHTQVYSHRIRRIADAMLVRGIELAISENISKVRRIFLVGTKQLGSFLEADDWMVMDYILRTSKGYAGRYFERLKNRQLLKEVFAMRLGPKGDEDQVVLSILGDLDFKGAKLLEGELAECFGIPKEMIIVDKQTRKNPTYRSPGVRSPTEEPIMVLTRRRAKPIRLELRDVSTVINNPTVEPETPHLYVYLPPEMKGMSRSEFSRRNQGTIRRIILESARGGRS